MNHVTFNNNSNNRTGGIGFTGLLTIVFIVLKLLGVITWSWVWVLSPIWITLVLVLIAVFIAIIFIVDNN
jgi:Flp pilus assembly protein TadB